MSITQSDQTGTKCPRGPGGGQAWPRAPGRRLAGALAWGGPCAVLVSILLGRNAWLFSAPVYEDADMGAYSIQIEQARRFSLFVGNYSREGFNHPGPAFLYVQAWGEELCYDLLRIVPAPWNGEVVGLYLLNAFFGACVVVVGARWGGPRGGLMALAAVGVYAALHPPAFTSDWMPYEYVPAYFAFLVSVASVAAGRSGDAWIAALSGWFLIHGHACFLFFVPLLWAAAIAVRMAPRLRRRTGRRMRTRPKRRVRLERRAWQPVAAISAVFALPIVVELALHWPGTFGEYLAYSGSARPGGHPAGQVAAYVLWFWWPHAGARAVAAALALAAAGAVAALPAGPVRRCCLALLGVDALSTLAFTGYAAVGIDDLSQHYIGYFSWSGPLIATWVLAWAGIELLAARPAPPGLAGRAEPMAGPAAALGVAAVLALAGCAAFAAAPQARLSTAHADPGNPAVTGPVADPSLPSGVARIGALAAGRYAVLSFPHDAWPAVTGILVQAERTGVRACAVGQAWEFMMTSQFICTPAQLSGGLRLRVVEPGQVPRGTPVLARLRRGIVTDDPK